MTSTPRFRMGPLPRRFAPDAYGCIMVGLSCPPNKRSRRDDLRRVWQLPPFEVTFNDHEEEEKRAFGLTSKSPYELRESHARKRTGEGSGCTLPGHAAARRAP
jgi:hypothetical protein